jgi:hypothetical protein
MIAAPAVRPVIQDVRGANRGRQTNPNYVRIVNPIAKRDVINLRLARVWVKAGRAEWAVEGAELRLIESHPANLAYGTSVNEQIAGTDAGYDRITSGFEWHAGRSGGATVLVTQRGAERV